MKAVVAYISFFDNMIIQEIVEVETKDFKEALAKHSAFSKCEEVDLSWLPDDYDQARQEAMNGELDFCITWID
jgi:hypothetical protein